MGPLHVLQRKIANRYGAADGFSSGLILLVLLAGCASAPRPGLTSVPVPKSELRGLASWYGHPYHGRRTASGERYDMEALTAAHRTLPFDAEVRVERLDNGRTVEVRINDRGPFYGGRVIDLSRAAARRLDMLHKGVAPVRVVPLALPPAKPARWLVLVGPFPGREQARRFASRQGGNSKGRVIQGWDGNSRLYRVHLEGFRSQEEAWKKTSRLRREGYKAFPVRVPLRR